MPIPKDKSSVRAEVEQTVAPSRRAAGESLRKHPKRKEGVDPDYAPTLVRKSTLRELRKLQRASKPPINLKHISEACHQVALTVVGGGEVMRRARILSKSES